MASGGPALGQTAVAISGNTIPRVGNGIVIALVPGTASTPEVIDTNIDSNNVMPGSSLIDTSGALMGVSTGVARASSSSGFVPVSVVVAAEGAAK
jgi:hypothetical protein